MNEQAITRFLAEEVMGWNKCKEWQNPGMIAGVALCTDREEDFWLPIHNIAHSFMVVEKMIENWMFELNWDSWWDAVISSSANVGRGEGKSASKAISLAAVRALATKEQIEEFEL